MGVYRSCIAGLIGLFGLGAFGASAQGGLSFEDQSVLIGSTCVKAKSSTLAKSTICSLETVKLEELYKSLGKPSYDQASSYHLNHALMDSIGAGYVIIENKANGLPSCRRTISAHHHMMQRPENTPSFDMLPDIAEGAAWGATDCEYQYAPFDPPISKTGEQSLEALFYSTTGPCNDAYLGLADDDLEVCEAGVSAMKNAMKRLEGLSRSAEDKASYHLAYVGANLFDIYSETDGDKKACDGLAEVWPRFSRVDPENIGDPYDAFGETVRLYEDTIAYCRKTFGGYENLPVKAQAAAKPDLSDLTQVSKDMQDHCETAAGSLPLNAGLEVCKDNELTLTASRAQQGALYNEELAAYWAAKASIHGVRAELYNALDKEFSARACMQNELNASALDTLMLLNDTAGNTQAGSAIISAQSMLPECRARFLRPAWGSRAM